MADPTASPVAQQGQKRSRMLFPPQEFARPSMRQIFVEFVDISLICCKMFD
ncbi:hypothetical protein [Acidovorax sp. SUPP3334]|uniref:hypothetical protein n=1 Tax=Acidovorax sp. SUPP3334 TaxID=2920881 RepID=UPI0023DE31A9|nr:hypothetical protein [Acidovorax sp. SUPP3334]GKT26395.1 hypothetical protein AVHM3334_20865 [Acidovorax sp. SUPP3334]